MDSITINKICTEIPILKYFFLGIVKFEDISMGKLTIESQNCGKFLIINVKDAHWIVLMWCGSAKIILFDSLYGKLTLPKHLLERIICKSFIGIKNILFIYGMGRLQNPEFLSCGEHVIYFTLYEIWFYLNNGLLNEHYISKIVSYCKKNKILPDLFVWEEIYLHLQLARPPNLYKVLNWFNDHK